MAPWLPALMHGSTFTGCQNGEWYRVTRGYRSRLQTPSATDHRKFIGNTDGSNAQYSVCKHLSSNQRYTGRQPNHAEHLPGLVDAGLVDWQPGRDYVVTPDESPLKTPFCKI